MVKNGLHQAQKLSWVEFPFGKQTGRQANQCTFKRNFCTAIQKLRFNVHWSACLPGNSAKLKCVLSSELSDLCKDVAKRGTYFFFKYQFVDAVENFQQWNLNLYFILLDIQTTDLHTTWIAGRLLKAPLKIVCWIDWFSHVFFSYFYFRKVTHTCIAKYFHSSFKRGVYFLYNATTIFSYLSNVT